MHALQGSEALAAYIAFVPRLCILLKLFSGLPLWNQHRMPLCFRECIQESKRVLTVCKQ